MVCNEGRRGDNFFCEDTVAESDELIHESYEL
jgi:hypothetical protein